jgi:hypothetical protein
MNRTKLLLSITIALVATTFATLSDHTYLCLVIIWMAFYLHLNIGDSL